MALKGPMRPRSLRLRSALATSLKRSASDKSKSHSNTADFSSNSNSSSNSSSNKNTCDMEVAPGPEALKQVENLKLDLNVNTTNMPVKGSKRTRTRTRTSWISTRRRISRKRSVCSDRSDTSNLSLSSSTCSSSSSTQSCEKFNINKLQKLENENFSKKQFHTQNKNQNQNQNQNQIKSQSTEKPMKFARNTLTLREILVSNQGMAAFLSFCKSQYAAENLLFWLHAEKFRLLLDKERAEHLKLELSHEAVVSHALQVYDRFLKQDADEWVCIQTETVKAIKSYLQDKPESIDVGLFVKAQQETLSTVENDIIPRFVQNAVLSAKYEIDEKLRFDLQTLLQKETSVSTVATQA